MDLEALADDFAVFNIPLDSVSIPKEEVSDFEVFDENWDSVLAFLRCRTQWRKEVPGMADRWVWHGLRYNEVECLIRNLGYKGKKARDIFGNILIMESAALPLLNSDKK